MDDKVRIKVKGEGKELPTQDLKDSAYSFSKAPRPDELLLVGAPIRHESKFYLEPVGLDTDGKVKPIDELSYAPAEWGTTDQSENFPPAFIGLADTDTSDGKKIMELARLSILKWYRIKRQSGEDGYSIEGAPDGIGSISDVLPLSSDLTTLQNPDSDGVQRPEQAYVQGLWYDEARTGAQNGDEKYPGSFSIDAQRGIVKFSEPVYQFNELFEYWSAAELYLTCTYSFSTEDGNKERYTKEKEVPGEKSGTCAQLVKQDDVRLHHRHTYDFHSSGTAGEKFTRIESKVNQAEADKAADHYLKAVLKSFEVRSGGTSVLEGIRDIELDGAISQVSIRCGGGQAATTTVSVNDEHDIATVPYAEKLRQDRAAKANETAEKLEELDAEFDQILGAGWGTV